MTGFSVDPLASVGVRRGDVIGGSYRIERVLGVGGMGVVALAFDEKLERDVAIKFVKSTFVLPEMHALFVEEARAMARVSHPNVLAVYSFGDHGETPYFAMEYFEGRTIADWLTNRAPETLPSAEDVVRVVEQACLGVEAIHASKTVHRDLKPSNILIDDGFHVAVGDFGLSCLAGPGAVQSIPVGTAAYMAPESVFGEASSFDYARDIYALGCIAYELFVGRPPFVGETAMNVLTKHVIEIAPPPSERRPGLGTFYDAAIGKALEKDPSVRHASVARLREALVSAHLRKSDPERILVAEDDPDWRDIMVSFLGRCFPHATVDSAADGVAALNAFCDAPYAVVLLDLEMPEMDGTRLTQALRAIDSARSTAIVVLTAAGGPSEWRALSAIGADAFLVKPVDLDDLGVVIRRTLRARRQVPLAARAGA